MMIRWPGLCRNGVTGDLRIVRVGIIELWPMAGRDAIDAAAVAAAAASITE